MDEEYTQSDISKEVERLMDEEGFEFGEAVKEAMSKGYKDGGLMIAIQKLAQGGMTYGDKTYHQYHDQYVPPDSEAMGYANGGGIGSMMIPKRQGLFMGGSPLTGEALNIYTSMNSYGYTDQEIADRLSGLGLYDPNTTTPPTTPPGSTPPSGGGSGGDGGGESIFDIKNKKTRNTKIDKGITAANADKGNLTLEEIKAMNDLSGQESMRGQITPKTTLEKIISSDKPNMLDIAGTELPVNEDIIDRGNPTGDSRIVSEELGSTGFGKPNMRDIAGEEISVNENFIDRGNPTGDSRIVSEEQGLVGGITDRNRGQITSKPTGGITTIDRPNMRDIAGPSTTVDESISIEDLSKPSNIGDFQITGAPNLTNQTGILTAPPSIGFAQDPDVEDPFGGKYTPSFEEKKEAEGILAGLVDKALNFSLSDIATMGQNTIINKALKTLGFSDPFAFLGTMGINKFKNKQVQKEIEKQIASAKTRKETRKIQDRLDKRENDINKNASKNDSKTGSSIVNPNSKYGKDKGYTGGNPNPHTSTGWSGSSKSNKSSSNKSSGGGGGGKGGGADMGSSNKGSVSTGAGNNPWGR
jgi:hypothetical protein